MASELVTYQSFALAQQDPEMIREVVAENLAGGTVTTWDFDRIRIPAGGGTTWEVPTIEGIDSRRSLDVVVLHARLGRSYWSSSLDSGAGESTPPDCSSPDARVGFGTPGGECSSCPMAQWGSDPKSERGQACKLRNLLLVLLGDSIMPVVLSLPPTSLKPWKQYAMRLSGRGVPYYGVVTRFSLEKRTSGSQSFSVAMPAFGAKLSAEELSQVKAFRAQFEETFRAVKIEADDVYTRDHENENENGDGV